MSLLPSQLSVCTCAGVGRDTGIDKLVSDTFKRDVFQTVVGSPFTSWSVGHQSAGTEGAEAVCTALYSL